jgi:hypothetical protein
VSRDIRHLGPDTEKALTRAVNELTLAVNEKLVETTPVDTGYARASWIPSVGSPSSATGGSESAPSSAAATSGQAQVATNPDLRRTLHITNNVDYIQKLNDGSSSQQPALFVERAIMDGVVKFNGRVIR